LASQPPAPLHLPIRIFIDNKYTIYCSQRLWHAKSNLDVLEKIYPVLESIRSKREVHLLWVPAHAGIPGNELADRLAKRGAHGESSNRPLSLAMNPEQKSRPNNTPTNSPFRTKYLLLADLAHTTPQPVTTRSQSRYNLRTLHPPPIRNQIFPGIDFSST
jgi:hypothetical protein